MPDHKQVQKNVNDTGAAWDRYRDTIEKHVPRRRNSIVNYTSTIGSKRGY